ncbi:beta-tubulin cofactor, partial [Cystoisospora suis]
RRSHLGKDERKTEVESCLSSSQQSCSKEASAHNLHTSPPTPTTAAPAEKDGEEVREAKDRSVSSTTSSSSSCEDEEEEERKRRFLREWLLPESVQGDIRQIVIKVEKRREYRGKGGDLIRIGVCKLIQALASSPLIVFKSATSKRYLATLMDGLKHFSEEVQLSSAEALRPLLFLRMDTTDILESFLPGLLANLKKPDEHIAARRGYVLALATLPPSVYRHCYRLATLRKKKEKEKSARMESNTMNISEEGMQRRKDEAMKDKNQECTMKIEDEKTPLSCSSRLSRGVKEDSTSTRTSQKVPKEEEKRQHEASGEDGGFLFDILRYEATSKMPLNDPGLNDAHTRRNALIAYGFALRAILSLSPSSFSSFTQDNPCSTPENPEDKEEKGEGEQAFRFSKSFWDEIVETLTVCCSDCQSDRRGDVGSWIREVAVEVICFLLENVNVDAPHASTLPLPSHHAHPQREQQEGEQQNNKERNRNDQMTCSSHAKEERSAVPPLSIASECEPSISVWEKLLGLVIRMALENLGRTRSRATFLLYRMTAPLPSTSRRYSPSAERKGEIYQEEGDRREDNQEAGKDSSDGRCPRPEYLASLSPPPFRIEWIWGRVFHDYSYELGPADIPPISVDTLHAEATHNTSTGENPCCSGSSPNIRRCLISHLRPEPRGLRFIQESLLPIAEKQRKAAEETKPVLPFHDLHLSDFSQPITLPLMPPSLLPSAQNHTGDHEPSSSSFSGAPIDGLSSSLKGCTTSSVLSRAEMTGEKDRKKEGVSDKEKEKLKKRDEDEECWMSSFDFLLDLSVIDGGYASLHKTRKSGVVLRLPFFTNPSITYPRLLIFLLFPVYRRRAAEGTCLGVGGALGSSADQTLRAVLSFFTHLRELLRDRSNDQVGQKRGLISEREDFLLENKQKKEEVQKRLFFSLPLNKQSDKTDDISALYLDVLHAIHKLGEKFEEKEKPEEHESSSLKLSRTSTSGILSMVSGSLIDVLLSCRDQKKKIRNKEEDKLPPVDESDFFDKLRTSALKTSIILASNDILTYRDATRMLSVLMDASLTSGPVGRSFQFIRDQCEAFIVLASSRSVDEGEGNEERGEGFVIGNTNEVLSIQKIALCKALQFLKHRFPKIRQFAAETLYSSLVLSLSSLAPCPDAQSTLLPARPTSQEKGFSSSGGALPCVTTGEQRQSSKLPESEESPFRLNEQQIDEVTDILTLTPWLEMQSDSKSHPVPGDDAHTSKSTETNPVERLIALFGIEKEWQAIQSKKPRK